MAGASGWMGVEEEEETGFWPEVVDVGLGTRGKVAPLKGMGRKAG